MTLLNPVGKDVYSFRLLENDSYEDMVKKIWGLKDQGCSMYLLTEVPSGMEANYEIYLKKNNANFQKTLGQFAGLLVECPTLEVFTLTMREFWDSELLAVENIYLFPALNLDDAINITHVIKKNGDVVVEKLESFLREKDSFLIQNESDGIITLLYTRSNRIREFIETY